MTINITELGPNSCSMGIVSDTHVNVRNAIQTWLSQHGWETFDVWGTGTNSYLSVRALTNQGGAYKYMNFDVRYNNYIDVTISEARNAVTHTGTNTQIFANYSQYCYITGASTLYLFAAQKHFGMFTLNGASYSVPIFVLEGKREQVGDTDAGYPSFFATMVGPLAGSQVADRYVAFPRNVEGVSATAAGNGATIRSRNGFSSPSAGIYPAQNANIVNCADSPIIHPKTTNSWVGYNQYLGRIFGVKTLPQSFGAMMDNVMIRCNADGFTDPSGDEVDHFILADGPYRVALPK